MLIYSIHHQTEDVKQNWENKKYLPHKKLVINGLDRITHSKV